MKNQFFSGKVKYSIQNENGKFKKVNEQILLEAVSFTDAEAMLYQYYEHIMKKTMLTITNIDKVTFDEFIFSKEELDERVFVIIKVKIEYQDVDSEKTKTQIYKCLYEVGSFEEAKKIDSESIAQRFSSMTTKSEIVSITKTMYEDFVLTETINKTFNKKSEIEESIEEID